MSRRDPLLPVFQGDASRQAHADLPAGTYEREVGRDGFFGPASHFYHRNVPTAFAAVSGVITPRAFMPFDAATPVGSPWDTPALIHNASVKVRFWSLGASMTRLVRNADGDDLLFVHTGSGALFCDYGHLAFVAGDYLLIPRGTLWRLQIDEPAEFLVIESTGGRYAMPEWGGIGRHAPFDFGVLDIPTLDAAFKDQQGSGGWEVIVKRSEAFGTIRYDYNPLDALGWKGDLYPIRLNVRDIRPLMSARVHLPPSAHTTFLGSRFVICTFVPRPLETDPGAMRIPFFHDNVDYDEILFAHRGVAASRGRALGAEGYLTYHPMGFTHGPHPQALPRMFDPDATQMSTTMVMIDAQDPLTVDASAESGEIVEYAHSWASSKDYSPDLATGHDWARSSGSAPT